MSTGKAFAVQLAPTFAPVPHVSLSSLLGPVSAAAPVVLGAAAAAGAVFLARAAFAGLDSYATTELAAAANASARRADTKAWDDAFAETMICNARLIRLREQAATMGDTTQLPAPFVYKGETCEQVHVAARDLDRLVSLAEKRQAGSRIAERSWPGLVRICWSLVPTISIPTAVQFNPTVWRHMTASGTSW